MKTISISENLENSLVDLSRIDYFFNEMINNKFYFKSYQGLSRLGEGTPITEEESLLIKLLISETSFVCLFLSGLMPDKNTEIDFSGLFKTSDKPIFFKFFKIFLVNEFTEFFDDTNYQNNLISALKKKGNSPEKYIDFYKRSIKNYLNF